MTQPANTDLVVKVPNWTIQTRIWLEQNLPVTSYSVERRPPEWTKPQANKNNPGLMTSIMRETVQVRFNNKDEALLFKLTWGGAA